MVVVRLANTTLRAVPHTRALWARSRLYLVYRESPALAGVSDRVLTWGPIRVQLIHVLRSLLEDESC